jgi:ribosomal protein L11 methylase PrmA
VGSVDAVRKSSMNVIVANISSAAIEDLAVEFARVRKPRSTLILSGFPEWDPVEGFEVKYRTQKGEWVCIQCCPN